MSAALKKLPWTQSQVLDELRSFPLLETFPEHLIEQLSLGSEIIQIPRQTEILKQGEQNDQLYFLSTGQVGVYVDGARVSKMQHKGDLLGEMSVITTKPVGATIIAETECTLVCMDSRVFLEMQGPERDLYLSILYRIYAMVLAEKLHDTNQKAKHFENLTTKLTAMQWDLEEANRTLEAKVEERTQKLEQQKAELMAGKNKMAEVINSKKLIFQKLADFHNNHLLPLKSRLDQLRLITPEDATIDEARKKVFDVQALLGPLTDQYSSEQAIQSKRVLLADTNKKQQIIAKMALGGTGVILDIVTTFEEGQAKLQEAKYDLVVFDTHMIELGNIARERNPAIALVLMTSDQVPSYLPELKKLKVIPNIVSRNEEDRTFTIKNIMTTVTKLLSADLFTLEKYLSWGVDVQSIPITGSAQRGELIRDVDTYFEKLGVRRANRDRIKSVLEEMLMNAIYDAPIDKDGKSLYNHLPRTVELSLKPEEQGLVRFATDGMLLAVSVRDPFGSLKGSTILKYLEHNYAGSANELNAKEGKGGAGRGLHQIVESSDLVVFNVEPGKRTEAIALFNVEAKATLHQSPSFHLFVK
ncbi:MAG TPA: cyclic nucleotide-binding domain-containing protein [Bdellovibrionales bacterium]|nr:cyclic nucleotide-binding domain-containing protein [Bdellovibrionales bacterium]